MKYWILITFKLIYLWFTFLTNQDSLLHLRLGYFEHQWLGCTSQPPFLCCATPTQQCRSRLVFCMFASCGYLSGFTSKGSWTQLDLFAPAGLSGLGTFSLSRQTIRIIFAFDCSIKLGSGLGRSYRLSCPSYPALLWLNLQRRRHDVYFCLEMRIYCFERDISEAANQLCPDFFSGPEWPPWRFDWRPQLPSFWQAVSYMNSLAGLQTSGWHDLSKPILFYSLRVGHETLLD